MEWKHISCLRGSLAIHGFRGAAPFDKLSTVPCLASEWPRPDMRTQTYQTTFTRMQRDSPQVQFLKSLGIDLVDCGFGRKENR